MTERRDKRTGADAYLAEQDLARIRERWKPVFSSVCARFDAPMHDPCATLGQYVMRFQKEKAAVFADAVMAVGEERAHKALDGMLDNLLPPSLLQLTVLLVTDDLPSSGSIYTTDDDDSDGSDDDDGNGIATSQQSPSPAPPRTYLEPVSQNEVEAVDYIFRYEPFGPGWFVLRCGHGTGVPATTFKSHPLRSARRAAGSPVTGPPGLRHFNDTLCVYHDHARTYTEQSMMVAFAQRVVDEDGEDVTDEWAEEANEHLQEKLARDAAKAAKRAKRRVPRPESSRPLHKPPRGAGGLFIKREQDEGAI
ncbi:hypothetical protein SCUCBS95973_007172 [Sporothrix curviconia]|uniref:Uncharacterized protein n=1 Tax=Sporothrix curviconia TaxID=1260050 RepID=A0ABP0CB84_9PEZI